MKTATGTPALAAEDRLGHFYEALLSHALDSRRPAIPHQTHQALPGVHVISDVVVPAASRPRFVLLAAHAQGQSGTNMKFWRNVAEVLEIHERYPRVVVINVIFPSRWKPGLLPLMAAAAGRQITFPEPTAARARALALLAQDADCRGPHQYKAWLVRDKPNHAAEVVRFLACELARALRDGSPSPLWARYARPAGHSTRIDYTGDTFIKKGFVRLALLDEGDRRAFLRHARDFQHLPEDVRLRAADRRALDVHGGIVRRYLPARPVAYLLRTFPPERIEAVIALVRKYHGAREDKLLLPLRGQDGLTFRSFYDALGARSRAGAEFIASSLRDWAREHPGATNLPLAYLYAIGKQLDPRLGHRALSAACGLPMIGGVSPVPRFLYGARGLDRRTLRRMAGFFAGRLAGRELPPWEALWQGLLSQAEDRLLKHRYVNYLLYACMEHCQRHGLAVANPGKPMVRIGNGLAGYCQTVSKLRVPGTVADSRFSFAATVRGEPYVFLVISAYGATHKHKEYPGRWRCALLDHDGEGFLWMAGEARCVVVLDGTWTGLFADLRTSLEAFDQPGIRVVCDAGRFLTSDPGKLC